MESLSRTYILLVLESTRLHPSNMPEPTPAPSATTSAPSPPSQSTSNSPTTFQAYAASYGLNSVTTGAPDADFDKDGIPNLLEYLLGGNPTLPNSGLLPTITKAPGSSNVVFTYKRKIAAEGLTQVIEHATSLSSTWTPAEDGENGVTIVTAPVPGDATAEQVTVTIPSTSTSRFVRLKASR